MIRMTYQEGSGDLATSNKTTNTMKFLVKVLILLLFLAFIAYYLRASFGDIFQQLGQTSLRLLIIVTSLGMGYLFLEGKMLKETVAPFSQTFTTWNGMMASCYTAFYRLITFGTGTIFAEINFYHRKQMTVSQSVGVAILRFIFFKISTLTIAIIALSLSFRELYATSPSFFWVLIMSILINAALSVGLLLAALSIKLQIGLMSLCNRFLKNEKVRAMVDRGNIQINALRRMLHETMQNKTVLYKVYFWSIGKILAWFIIPYACLVSDYPEINVFWTIGLISFVTVIAGVIPTPAGIGSFDFAYLVVFSALVGTVDAASSLLLYRYATFLIPFLVGLIYVVSTNGFVKREPKKIE